MKLSLALVLVFSCAAAVSACAAPREQRVAPDLEPPPARSEPSLTKAQALDLVSGANDADDAVRSLDTHRLGFSLDPATIDWFKDQGAAPEVIDYLKKRSRVDWDGMRGDIDPRAPEGSEYIDPRRAFDDFAGDRRDYVSSPRSRDPFGFPPAGSVLERRSSEDGPDRGIIFLPR